MRMFQNIGPSHWLGCALYVKRNMQIDMPAETCASFVDAICSVPGEQSYVDVTAELMDEDDKPVPYTASDEGWCSHTEHNEYNIVMPTMQGLPKYKISRITIEVIDGPPVWIGDFWTKGIAGPRPEAKK